MKFPQPPNLFCLYACFLFAPLCIVRNIPKPHSTLRLMPPPPACSHNHILFRVFFITCKIRHVPTYTPRRNETTEKRHDNKQELSCQTTGKIKREINKWYRKQQRPIFWEGGVFTEHFFVGAIRSNGSFIIEVATCANSFCFLPPWSQMSPLFFFLKINVRQK
jgi:hypothetical protein